MKRIVALLLVLITAASLFACGGNVTPPAETTDAAETTDVDMRAPVAQLDRASASGVEGRGFESRRVYHIKKSL